jgi:hypothetical protein
MPYGKPKLKGTSNVTSAKQVPPSLKGGNKQAPPSLKGATKRKVSAMGSKNPIGPQTKRETKKSERKGKITPPLSASGSAEMKAAKKKRVMNTAATVAGSVAGFLTKFAVDNRLNRGAMRIKNEGGPSTTKDRWRAGKGRDKKSTKK